MGEKEIISRGINLYYLLTNKGYKNGKYF